MIKKLSAFIGVFTLGFVMTGCAHKSLTGMEQVTQTQNSLTDTDKKLEKAQSELTNFQATLKDLNTSLKDTKSGIARDEAVQALSRLSLRIEQAQVDLRTVREENRMAAQDLDRRLKGAAESTREATELRNPAPVPSRAE